MIIFDNAGVGRSTGDVPTIFKDWARDMIFFVNALNLRSIDIMGFSMGGLAGEAILARYHEL